MSLLMVLRWSARVLSGKIVLFFGFFLFAHLVGDQGRPSRPLNPADYIILTTVALSLAGLMLAWKWELLGAVITLAAVLVCASLNWKVLLLPGALIPITAMLYLLSWWIFRASTNGYDRSLGQSNTR